MEEDRKNRRLQTGIDMQLEHSTLIFLIPAGLVRDYFVPELSGLLHSGIETGG